MILLSETRHCQKISSCSSDIYEELREE